MGPATPMHPAMEIKSAARSRQKGGQEWITFPAAEQVERLFL